MFFCIATPVFCGQLGSFIYTNSLNYPRADNIAVIANDTVIYVFGEWEWETDTPLPVERAIILPNGSLSAWTIESERYSGVRDSAVGAYAYGYLYVIGGEDATNGDSTTAERAQVNPDGTLGVWSTISILPSGFVGSTLVQTSTFLYVIGGGYSGSSYVYRIQTNPDGTFGSWILCTAQLNIGRDAQESYLINTTLYVMDGYFVSGGTKTVEKATVFPDGELSAFTTIGNTVTYHEGGGIAYDGQYLYIIDGYEGGPPTYQCEKVQVYPDGSLGTWEPATAQQLNNSEGAGGFVQTTTAFYSVGGYNGGAIATVEYAPIIFPLPTGIKKREWEIFN